ncbi:hypothetical protein ACFXGT_40405 [Streptomyces sp. NPDC059352]|uniref:hypothetical protein n=1 Tax=Streptomyces sp. NPDC059352 TaxID=3346810 RepID=UPI0036C04844
MSDRRGDDDSAYREAVQAARRATRWGWAAIGGVSCLLVTALIALVVLAVLALAYGAVSMN